jgi:DNA-binding transcriptional ArsR family regulator
MVAVDETFAALADPSRVAIVTRLARGSATVSELAEPFDMSLRAVLKHVQVLEDAGLVRTAKAGRVRRCELQPQRMHEAARWIDQQRQRWERRLDRLDDYVRTKGER